jgi:cobalt-zinc-cadmium resistance protein CzcA
MQRSSAVCSALFVSPLVWRQQVTVPIERVLNSAPHVIARRSRPIFFSLLIIIAAYIPLFTLERVERRLFTPMAFTVCYALLGAMLIALTLIPVLAT